MSNIELPAISYNPASISSQLLADLNNDQSQQATLEEQLSTGNVVNSPSDNPAAAAELMQLNAGMSRAGQYSANATTGMGWLSLGTSTLNSVLSTLQSVQQTVSALSSGQLSGQSAAAQGAATEIQSAMQQVLGLANTTYGGQALFSGTGNATEAYDSNGNFVGGGSAPTQTVAPGVTVPVSVTGPQIFGTGSSGLLGPNGILSTLVTDVSTGTTASINKALTTDSAALNAAIQTVTGQAAQLGAAYQQMQRFSSQASDTQAALQSQISSQDSVNLAQATTQLTQAQQTYQSGLWATAQIEEHSLVSYL